MRLHPATRHSLGPRRPGGRYFCGYWRQEYEVVEIRLRQHGWSILIRWEDGREVEHCTAWDHRRDRVVSPPR